MLKEKLSKLNEMCLHELIMFERDVINSLLSKDEQREALKQIEQMKWKKNIDDALVEISEGVGFD